MIALEALQSVQFVSVEDRRLAVLDAEDWEALVEWLETMEDIQTAKEAFTQLELVDGDRDQVGWLKWDDVTAESMEDYALGKAMDEAKGTPLFDRDEALTYLET